MLGTISSISLQRGSESLVSFVGSRPFTETLQCAIASPAGFLAKTAYLPASFRNASEMMRLEFPPSVRICAKGNEWTLRRFSFVYNSPLSIYFLLNEAHTVGNVAKNT